MEPNNGYKEKRVDASAHYMGMKVVDYKRAIAWRKEDIISYMIVLLTIIFLVGFLLYNIDATEQLDIQIKTIYNNCLAAGSDFPYETVITECKRLISG